LLTNFILFFERKCAPLWRRYYHIITQTQTKRYPSRFTLIRHTLEYIVWWNNNNTILLCQHIIIFILSSCAHVAVFLKYYTFYKNRVRTASIYCLVHSIIFSICYTEYVISLRPLLCLRSVYHPSSIRIRAEMHRIPYANRTHRKCVPITL